MTRQWQFHVGFILFSIIYLLVCIYYESIKLKNNYINVFTDAVTKSAAFFFLATILLVMAEFFFMIAHVSRPRHELCVFVAGVAFTICGK